MLQSVHSRWLVRLAKVAAAVGSGVLLGLTIGVGTDLFSSGPRSVAACAALATCALAVAPVGRWRAWIAGVAGGAALLSGESVGHAIVGGLGWEFGVGATAAVLALAVFALASPLRAGLDGGGVV